ncbi:unnamed protein product [Pylaiella littoralis]
MIERKKTLVVMFFSSCCCLISSAASASGALSALAGLVVGVIAGRMSRERGSGLSDSSTPDSDRRRENNPLFATEGWEGEADVSDWEPFRLLGRSMVEYIADYYEGVESRPVRAKVEPGYLKKRLTQQDFPLSGESWGDIMADVESHIMPGITHWQHPRFFAWFPAHSSPPALLGDMLASMFNVIGFSWEASPASTELETLVLDQLGRAVGLPEAFLSAGDGGGVIQGSASEGTAVALLAARTRALKHMRSESPAGVSDSELLAKMTLYTSDQAHSSVQKAANIAGLGSNLRVIPTRGGGDEGEEQQQQQQQLFTLDPADLCDAMREDAAAGLTPVFVCANVGSTNTCAVDPVRALGEACRSFCGGEEEANKNEKNSSGNDGDENRESNPLVPWLHVDAAYAGSAAVCPENRWILDGIEAADSYLFNAHKWLLVNFDCTAMWVKRSACLVDALSVTPEILRSKEYNANQVSDFRDWQIPLGRKFRSLKIWLTMRAYGLDKVRGLVRRHTQLAIDLESMVNKDDKFEIVAPVRFGLVCFRLKGSNAANEELRRGPNLNWSRVVSSGLAFFSSTKLGGRTCLRVSVGGLSTKARHVREFWDSLRQTADAVTAEGF